jgi:3-hydroxyethyl bacteriochlorophyllide a dehydrogenase
MECTAVVFRSPEQLELRRLPLAPRRDGEVVVAVEWSAISTGTERLLWTGQMPPFPGMGYPLVPGYESVGRVVEAADGLPVRVGDRVFVPGASCFEDVRGLFGGAASRLHVPAARLTKIDESLGDKGVLLALAATAEHALAGGDGRPAELIVGHGVLGRLLARIAVCRGATPVVWEKNPRRAAGAVGYQVKDPSDDPRRDYRAIYDVSGDASLIDTLVSRLAKGGEIVLAGFYDKITFGFPLAFMKEARLRIATEFQAVDVAAVQSFLARDASAAPLSLDGLITHRCSYEESAAAYRTAFTEPDCLKMLLDWRTCT